MLGQSCKTYDVVQPADETSRAHGVPRDNEPTIEVISHMLYEVEQKYPLEEFDTIFERLEEFGASFGPPLEQVDRYFSHPARDFSSTDEALRIRSVGEENRVTYKGPKIDQTTKTRREIELPLPSGESTPAAYQELFDALGFQAVATVRKDRRSAVIEWGGHTLSIALDEVAGLGRYIELEIAADESALDSARAVLAELAEQLKLTGAERRGYLDMLLEKMSQEDNPNF